MNDPRAAMFVTGLASAAMAAIAVVLVTPHPPAATNSEVSQSASVVEERLMQELRALREEIAARSTRAPRRTEADAADGDGMQEVLATLADVRQMCRRITEAVEAANSSLNTVVTQREPNRVAIEGAIARLSGDGASDAEYRLLSPRELVNMFGPPTFVAAGANGGTDWVYTFQEQELRFTLAGGLVVRVGV